MISWPPLRVTVLTWVVLFLTVWNAFRLWTAFAWKAQLSEYAWQASPFYVSLTGAIWVAVGLKTIWGLWQPGRPGRQFTVGAAAVYSAWYWADRLLLQPERANWPFAAGLNLLLLVQVFISINSSYFQREAYERESEK